MSSAAAAAGESASWNIAACFSCHTLAITLVLTCQVCHGRGNKASLHPWRKPRVKCCSADDGQRLKSQILWSIFKPGCPDQVAWVLPPPCVPHVFCVVAQGSSWHLLWDTADFKPLYPASQPGLVPAETMSLHSHSCICFSPPNPELFHFFGFWGDGCFLQAPVALCCTRSSTDACAHWSTKVHTKSNSLPWVNGNTPFPPEKPNLWQSVGYKCWPR